MLLWSSLPKLKVSFQCNLYLRIDTTVTTVAKAPYERNVTALVLVVIFIVAISLLVVIQVYEKQFRRCFCKNTLSENDKAIDKHHAQSEARQAEKNEATKTNVSLVKVADIELGNEKK